VNFAPLLQAPLIIQIHALAAIAAFFLGLVQFIALKGSAQHKIVGSVWVALMITATVTSAFIQRPVSPGDPFWTKFSPIHIFTVITTVGIVVGLKYLLTGGPELKNHKDPFTGIYIGGILIAGFFAFMPGRIMHAVVFG